MIDRESTREQIDDFLWDVEEGTWNISAARTNNFLDYVAEVAHYIPIKDHHVLIVNEIDRAYREYLALELPFTEMRSFLALGVQIKEFLSKHDDSYWHKALEPWSDFTSISDKIYLLLFQAFEIFGHIEYLSDIAEIVRAHNVDIRQTLIDWHDTTYDHSYLDYITEKNVLSNGISIIQAESSVSRVCEYIVKQHPLAKDYVYLFHALREVRFLDFTSNTHKRDFFDFAIEHFDYQGSREAIIKEFRHFKPERPIHKRKIAELAANLKQIIEGQ